MADFVFAPPAPVTIPVAGGGMFPVRRVFCVGRNYAEHALEMGGDTREPPFFFTKPADAVVSGGRDIPYPPQTSDLHHEIELVVAIGKGGADIAAADAASHIFGYAVGIDLTRRDLQALAKKTGRPWDMAKGFDFSAPIGDIAPVSASGHPADGAITLEVNGVNRQRGMLSEMTWDVNSVVADLSRYVTLAPGDIIMTGTPAGVAAVVRGDLLEGKVEGVGTVTARIV
ncbi:MAG: fumarylacetoacetate hydrolase family protein [Devosia sp.]|uniref:fumarylacetoacetate hydrolase family protein n=1 Tax=unclassified Devosia TaxID=196773 RepID=UPI0019DDBCAD|nr:MULTISPECIES: fumarylacetoacetate hydrolase family protein [unclassified Devosia]MBF0679028.1 fumarylacetoacetate hydrolase family protein [Devosia sp.]WEJ33642.1 fumarylacetoacetate hydrolase family protein [Devosia sp. SD17-2]